MAEKKNRHAVALGRKGGLARSKALTPADKKLAAQHAAQARWQGKCPHGTPIGPNWACAACAAAGGGPSGPSGPSKSAL